MRYEVSIATVEDYPHTEAFAEIAESVYYGLLALGHDAILTRTTAWQPDRRLIVFGPNVLAWKGIEPPSGAILFNLEQVHSASPWSAAEMYAMFRRFEVWDYSHKNAEALAAMGVPRPKVVPIGWRPELARVERAEPRFDVLFYGSMNERRARVIEACRREGLVCETLFGVYGPARDACVARAKVVLNVHAYDAQVFEEARVSYLLGNGVAVVSEETDQDAMDVYRDAVVFAPYDAIAGRCRALVDDADTRAALQARARRWMAKRDTAPLLSQALAA